MQRAISILALVALAMGLPKVAGQTPDVASTLVSYQFPDSLSDAPDQPNVVSALVCYQFLDSLGDIPEQPNVVSPLASYQYFDWLGDENLTFEFSPVASYYFGGGVSLSLSGMVRDSAGSPVSGAEVILQRLNAVFWQGYTSVNGTLPSATLPAGNFNVVVIKAGYTSLFQSVAGDAGGPVALNLTLQPTMALPDLVTVNRVPAETAIRTPQPETPSGERDPNLRVFNDTFFSQSGAIRDDRMTIVITHGWLSNLDTWATEMASLISNKQLLGEGNEPNIVGWDWRGRAGGFPPPVDQAAVQGEHLGKALYLELGPGYGERIHFIGHSLGTIVNAAACDYLHGLKPRESQRPPVPWQTSATKPHVTLLDQAEVANALGSSVKTSTIGSWFDSQVRSNLLNIPGGAAGGNSALGYKSPFAASSAWTDSYNSMVGLYHPSVVNVALVGPPSLWNPFAGHSYSHEWYRASISQVNSGHAMGFNRAYERATVFPPAGPGHDPGDAWTSGATNDIFDLVLVSDPSAYGEFDQVLRSSVVVAGTAIGSVDSLGRGILSGYETGLSLVVDLGGSAIHKTGQVAATVSEKIGNLWDAALDQASSINPDTFFTGSIAAPTLKLLFSTPASSLTANPRRSSLQRSQLNATQSPQAWFPVRVPANAGFLVFDFTVTGDPAEDLIVCAVNEQNVFTLPARFAPDGSPASTDFLDISAHAGQQVELYFGLVGGTSSGCTLAIDGIRFVTIPLPKLAATAHGGQIRLQWPAAATGWVPQRNPGLAEEDWEDLDLPEFLAIGEGIVSLEMPRLPTREFFRLKRVD